MDSVDTCVDACVAVNYAACSAVGAAASAAAAAAARHAAATRYVINSYAPIVPIGFTQILTVPL